MKNKDLHILLPLIIIALYFLIKGLVLAASFLIPLTFAILAALVFIPLARKLENIRFPTILASLVCTILAVICFLGFFLLMGVQGQNISEEWPKMKSQIKPKLEKSINTLENKTGISLQETLPGFLKSEDKKEKETSKSTDEKEQLGPIQSGTSKIAPTIAMNVFGFFGSSFLTFIYLFFLLTYRKKIKHSMLMFFSSKNKSSAESILNQSIVLALNFLGGRLLLIFFLAVIYAIGLSIAGVENAILISVIAASLSLIPYLGLVAGFVLAITLTILGGGDTTSIIIVVVTYSLAQFIESYILEPYVVGDKVNLNPLMTIMVVIMGGLIWGISGMVLSIPVAAILKIVFDSIPSLKPLGYLLGDEETKEEDEGNKFKKFGENLWDKISGK